MPLPEATRAARRADQAVQVKADLNNLLRSAEALRRRIVGFVGQDLHKNGDTDAAFANDDTAVGGNHAVTWRELYEAKSISDEFNALFFNSGNAALTPAQREAIAKQYGYDLP